MNFRKYFDIILLLILLEILSNSSADEWKKLKRKLFALTLLHGIRVKTIIPLPFPLPLPFVVKKQITPVILPQKRVPFLVPKPVPFYHIIPNFVPISPKEPESHNKHEWPEEESLISASQLTHEDYLIPPDNSGLDRDIYKLSAIDEQHQDVEHPVRSTDQNKFNRHMFHHDALEDPSEIMGQHPDIERPVRSNEHNKYNRHKFHHDAFVDPFELNSKHKFPKNKRKIRKEKTKPFEELKEFHFNEEYDGKYEKNRGEKYEDLLMVSSALKTEPHERPTLISYTEGNTPKNNREVNNHRLSDGYKMNNKLLTELRPSVDKNNGNGNKDSHLKGTDPPGVKTTTKKIKLGEIRLRPNQLKQFLAHHTNNSSK